MSLVRLAIDRPVGVAVGVILVVMFGLIGLGAIPVQLTPTVDRPTITVTTSWPGRSPQEIVDEITKEQEERLKTVAALDAMRSTSSEGSSEITLEFDVGADIPRALQEVSDALRQVPDYPEEVDEPVIKAADGAAENAIAWIIIDLPRDKRALYPGFDITTIFDGLDKEVKPYLRRIEGVAEVNIYGGREREVRVLLDPAKMALRSISPEDVLVALRAQNRNVSAGTIAEGKRDYPVRVTGQFTRPEQVLETIVATRDSGITRVRDLGRVELSHQKQRGFVRSGGDQSIAMNVIRESGANVMDIMAELRQRLDDVKRDIVPRLDPVVGDDLRLRQVYDETDYIRSSIDLVVQNLWVGGLIASGVLLLFLRSLVLTGIIALAIPISVIGTFLVLLALGRTLNVVSLAGLAFAVGMVVDNAIVVLENIDSKLKRGQRPRQAALRGGSEVFGAILASTLTTIAVFVPILTIQEEAGQLFRDIALAIVASVSLSLIVSITVIPSAAAACMRSRAGDGKGPIASLFGLATLAGRVSGWAAESVRWCMTSWRGWSVRPAVIVVMTSASLFGAALLAPPMDYLPAGNRNLVFGGLLIPPGYSVDQMKLVAERIEAQLEPYALADINQSETVNQLGPILRFDASGEMFDPVPIDNYFIGSFGGGMFVGATSQDEQVVRPIGNLATLAMNTIPGAFGGAEQSSIFGQGPGGGGNTVDIEISGSDLGAVQRAAEVMFGMLMGMEGYGPRAVRPNPANFNLLQEEYQLTVNTTGRELGLTTALIGDAVRGLVDGVFAGDYLLDGDTIDMVLLPEGESLSYKERLATIPIATPAGRTVPLDTVVDARPAQSPQSIQRIEELPSVTLQVIPPPGMALESVMRTLRDEVIDPAREAGTLDSTMRVRLEGTAARLDKVRAALFGVGEEAQGTSGSLAGASRWVAGALGVVGVLVAIGGIVRAVMRRSSLPAYGSAGALLLAAALGFGLMSLGDQPELVTARFIWALAVTYLLMCALFESFVYPLVIMFSVPLAVVGGFMGLSIVHAWTLSKPTIAPQQLDVLTMLGFVILIGVVVNNAILLVHRALRLMREGDVGIEPMAPSDAIAEAVRNRIRPIFMSTLTSVGGMAPLVLFPGSGSEMYRGLGSVVVGGLLVSTVFTLGLVPMCFSLVVTMRQGLESIFARGRASHGV